MTCQIATETDKILQQDCLNVESIKSLSSLFQSGSLLNNGLQTWEDQTFELYGYQSFDVAQFLPTGTPLATEGATITHVYTSLSIGAMWNFYRTTRIFLLRCLIRCLAGGEEHDLATTMSRESITPIVAQIQVLADNVCASVSYMLGEIDQEAKLRDIGQSKAVGGLFLLWPLGTLLFLEYLPPEQIAWVKKRLIYIRNVLGIQQAMSIVRFVEA